MQKYILAYLFQKSRRHFKYTDFFYSYTHWQNQGEFHSLYERFPQLQAWKDPIIQKAFFTEWESSLRNKIYWSTPVDAVFPRSFFQLEMPIFLFRYQGHPVWSLNQNLGIVGAREPDQKSLEWMDEVLPKTLNQHRCTVVSGGARGIDQKAHMLALRSDCPTVIALPSGLLKAYPGQIQGLMDQAIAQGGAIISEYENRMVMHKSHFIERNRLIVSLSQLMLAIDVGRRSGSMISARQAILQGKPLLVLPTHPMDLQNAGGLDLLMEGATPVRDDKDLLIILDAELNAQCPTIFSESLLSFHN